MASYYNLTNFTPTLTGLVQYGNNITGGLLGNLFVIAVSTITFLILKGNGEDTIRAISASSIIGFVLGFILFLPPIGIFSWQGVSLFFIVAVLSTVMVRD